jgi:hypothetical protein
MFEFLGYLFFIDWKLMTCGFSIVHSTKRKKLIIVIYNNNKTKKKRENFKTKRNSLSPKTIVHPNKTNSCVYLWM